MSPSSTDSGSNIKGVDIRVIGDVNLDTLVVPLRRSSKQSGNGRMLWQKEGNWWRHRRRGGAWLLREIIDAALKQIRDKIENSGQTVPEVKSYQEGKAQIDDDKIKSCLIPNYLSSSAILDLFPKSSKGTPTGKDDKVYRVKTVLGWVHDDTMRGLADNEESPYKKSVEHCLQGCLEHPTLGSDWCNILMLHDTANHFRRVDREILEEAIKRHYIEGRTWIVWHMYSPLANGNLWALFADSHKDWLDQTIAVVKVECLRQSGANLPENISLEQESNNFEDSIENIPDLQRLIGKGKTPADPRGVRHLVVHQAREGVIHYDREKGLSTSCYYCPKMTVDHASRKLGTMVGFTSILVSAIVRGITWSLLKGRDIPTGLIEGIKLGAVLDHLHYLNGYGDQEMLKKDSRPEPYKRLFDKLADVARGRDEKVIDVEKGGQNVEENVEEKKPWTDQWNDYHLAALSLPQATERKEWNRIKVLIRTRAGIGASEHALDEEAEKLAQEIVRFGLEKALEPEKNSLKDKVDEMPGTPPADIHCPFEVHGRIKTAYHVEIEKFASIRLIMQKYLNDERWTFPLCIAVFGQPGSGKTFTIRQLLGSIKPDIANRPLEFNVAQFTDPKDLQTAFHKVQDEAVAGGVPLVFFDEFDASFGRDKLGWLKFFLAPMQDGKFKAGESTYRIGRAIFVFAGGISKSWHDFYEKHRDGRGKALPESETSEGNKRKASGGNISHDDFKNAKGPDFVSRLRGYLDIATVNCLDGKDEVDQTLMFRRAVLLRSLLEDHIKEIISKNTGEAQIELDVLRAFLTVPRYEHESRSMQAIIEMSRASARGRYQKSSLPAREQLNMHVDAADFFNRMERVKRKVTEEGIRELAYLKWEASGRQAGDGQQFWRQAEEELRQKKLVSVEEGGQIECPLAPAPEPETPTSAKESDSLREGFERMPDKVRPVGDGGSSNPEGAAAPINQGKLEK